MARRAARRAAASLRADDTSGNGSSLEISPFTVGAGSAGSPIHVGSLFRGETAQVQAVATVKDAIDGSRFKEKGVNEAHTTVSLPHPAPHFSHANAVTLASLNRRPAEPHRNPLFPAHSARPG